MKKEIKSNIELLNRYMNDNIYLRLDQIRNDRIRKSLSWKITQPVRSIGKYKYLFRKKKSYCDGYKEWSHKFPQFNDKDIEIFSKFRDRFSRKIIVILILKEFTYNDIRNFLHSIHKQKFKIDNIFILSKNINKDQMREIEYICIDLNFSVIFNSVIVENTAMAYVGYCDSILKDNAFSVHTTYCDSNAVFSYSDEEYILPDGKIKPVFKPQFSIELLNSVDYLKCGLFIHNMSFFKDHVLYTLCSTLDLRKSILNARNHIVNNFIAHIPFVLNETYIKYLPQAESEKKSCTIYQPSHTVSIIIPTKSNYVYIKKCLESIVKKTIYQKSLIEIIIINNGGKCKKLDNFIEIIKCYINVIVINYDKDFNYSLINNLGFSISTGEMVIFLNDDTKLLDGLWLHKIINFLCEKDVGVVGCKLLYGNRRVQHNGCVIGGQTFARHIGLELTAKDGGYLGLMNATREVTAVTGACMALRRNVFSQTQGFDQNLKVAFNDILLCLQSRQLGYRNIVISDPLFVHYESISRGLDLMSDKINIYRRELEYIKNKTNYICFSDQFYNENLSFSSLYQLSFPPRRIKKWRNNVQKNYKKNVFLLYDDEGKIERLKNTFEDNCNIKSLYVDTESYIKNKEYDKISENIFINDTDYLIISSYNILDLCDIIGNYCRIFFSYNYFINQTPIFFELSGKAYIFRDGEFVIFKDKDILC